MTHLRMTGLVAAAGLGLVMFAGCQNRGTSGNRTNDTMDTRRMDDRRMDDRRGDAGSGGARDAVSSADGKAARVG